MTNIGLGQGFAWIYQSVGTVIDSNTCQGAWTYATPQQAPCMAPGRVRDLDIGLVITNNYISGFDSPSRHKSMLFRPIIRVIRGVRAPTYSIPGTSWRAKRPARDPRSAPTVPPWSVPESPGRGKRRWSHIGPIRRGRPGGARPRRCDVASQAPRRHPVSPDEERPPTALLGWLRATDPHVV